MIELNRKVLVISVALMAVAMLATPLLGTVLARPFYKDISVEKASRLILSEDHPDLVVLDLRPAFMYATGHIPGAINVPVIELTGGTPPVILHWDVLEAWIESAEGQSHLNDKIIIHCLAGLASPTGAQNLIDAGFKKVNSMDGGFNAWAAAGYPTVTQNLALSGKTHTENVQIQATAVSLNHMGVVSGWPEQKKRVDKHNPPFFQFNIKEVSKLSLERALKAVMSLGLSETDAQVYVFLALNGPHKAIDITKKMNLYKEQLYRSLRNLKNKEVVKSTVNYPAVFSAIPFEKILDLLAEIKKEQAQALRDVREELLSTWKNMTKKTPRKIQRARCPRCNFKQLF